jgi:hypothetical protein
MLRVAVRCQKADAVCLCARCIRLPSEINWRRIVTEAGNASVVAFSRDWYEQTSTEPHRHIELCTSVCAAAWQCFVLGYECTACLKLWVYFDGQNDNELPKKIL